jgi:putative ABC transport system substrate-binding protein
MNKRRKLVVALGAGALVSPWRSFAQQTAKVWRIGFLGTATASGYVKEVDAIRAGLRDLGYVEGKNIVIEYRWAESDPERLKAMAAEFVTLKVDAIITHGFLGTRTAAQATKTIPIVMADGPDPVAMGLVASLARPGGNVTGSTAFQTELVRKRFELLKEAAPRIKRAALLLNPQNPFNAVVVREMQSVAKGMKVELHEYEVKSPDELTGTFAAMSKARIEAAVISEDPLFNSNPAVIGALAATHRIAASGLTILAEAGGLLGYGVNRAQHYARAAIFVDKILKGAKPGDLPVERATKFDFIVNLKTAKALGLKIPNSILVQATKVIE